MGVNPEQIALEVLGDHGYADTDTYGECFCREVFSDAYDMAAHQIVKLKEAGLMIGLSTTADPSYLRSRELSGEDIKDVINGYDQWLNNYIEEETK